MKRGDKKLTLSLLPPSSRLRRLSPSAWRPLILEIRFCTKYIVLRDVRWCNASGIDLRRLKERSSTLVTKWANNYRIPARSQGHSLTSTG